MSRRNDLVDVVIPIYRPDEKLERLLTELGGQSCPPGKVILLQTGAEGPSRELLMQWLKRKSPSGSEAPELCLEHIRKEEFDHGGTRNRGASLSRAKYLVFMTQDAVPEGEALIEELLRPFFEGEQTVAASYARQLPWPDSGLLEACTRSFNYPSDSHRKSARDIPALGIKTFFCSNVCAAYRMEYFHQLGGFPERTIFNEDMLYAARAVRAGYEISYTASARVFHSHNYNGAMQLRRNFDLAVSQVDAAELFEGLRAEKEGVRLVKQTAAQILAQKKPWLLWELVWLSGCKYLGYRLGKCYRRLPRQLVKRLSLQRSYWEK